MWLWLYVVVAVQAAAGGGSLTLGAANASAESLVAEIPSNLPIILIRTQGTAIPPTQSDSYAQVDATFAEHGDIEYTGPAGIRLRGRSSAQFPKKQYRLEIWDEQQEDLEVGLFGLPSESDWVLYGPYSDKSLMRNYLAYSWWADLGHYSVRTRFCELWISDDDDLNWDTDYRGVYLLTETVEQGNDRVENAEAIIEMGNADSQDFSSGLSGQSVAFAFEDPKAEDLTSEESRWIKTAIARFELALYGTDFADPEKGYAALTDVNSQIDYQIMREFTRNFDGGSTFFQIDADGRLIMGPLWDYNMAMGNVNYAHNDEPGYETAGWNDSYMAPGVNGWCPWWYRFMEDPAYQQRLANRWRQLREGMLSDERILARIETVTTYLDEGASDRNFTRWPVLGTYVWANPPGYEDRTSFPAEVDWLRQWLLARAAWLDGQWLDLAQTPPPTPAFDGGLIVTELMYHPAPPFGQAHEFLELKNTSDHAISLAGIRFSEGIKFEFPAIDLAAGAIAILAKEPQVLGVDYGLPATVLLLGPYEGRLSNGGESLTCLDSSGRTIAEVSYDDDWCPLTDGRGFSLNLHDPATADPNSYSQRRAWLAGTVLGGTPGFDDPLAKP